MQHITSCLAKEIVFFEKKRSYIFQNHEYDDQLQHPLNVCKPIYIKHDP